MALSCRLASCKIGQRWFRFILSVPREPRGINGHATWRSLEPRNGYRSVAELAGAGFAWRLAETVSQHVRRRGDSSDRRLSARDPDDGGRGARQPDGPGEAGPYRQAELTKMARLRGRAPRGERLRASVPYGHWRATTFVAGLRLSGIDAPRVIDGLINGESLHRLRPAHVGAKAPTRRCRRHG